jgi:GT2 family glycosyltransferase
VAYRRDALFEAGLFDERFVLAGAEDIDLGLRVAALGPVVVEPTMVMLHPPRPMTVWQRILRARRVDNDWLLHAKHPELSGWPSPWGSVAWRTRDALRALRDRDLIAGSPARAARNAAISVGTVAVAIGARCANPRPQLDP